MELSNIQGVGEKTLKAFNKKGIVTMEDLVTFYPINYHVYSNELVSNTDSMKASVTISGVIVKNISEYKPRSNLLITNYFISNGHEEIKVVAFNQRHLRFTLKQGDHVKINGKYDPSKNQIVQNKVEIVNEDEVANPNDEIVAVYSKITGVSNLKIQKIILEAVKDISDDEYFKNLVKVHAPKDKKEIEEAYKYLKYREFSTYFKKLKKLQEQKIELSSDFVKNVAENDLNTLLNVLPFALTEDQDKTLKNIVKSFNMDTKTQTLVLGDVGSGKTIIAIILSYLLVKKDYQVAIMAPTEVLSKQLFANFKNILEDFDIPITLLTSSIKKRDKNRIKDRILLGLDKIVVGTHALIQEDIVFKNLGICIIDEQHRFGVEQRNALIQKTLFGEYVYLSATPIPRTLAQSIFGVMNVEFIETKPANRKKIETEIYTKSTRKKIFSLLEKELDAGNQAYVVAPTIEKTDIENLEDVQSLYENFSNYYKDRYNIGLIHGSVKSKDKDIIMEKFSNHEYDILVATTVIEVGVDIKDATVILIVNAERFGLAALHQLRGRVGRSDKQSYCLLYDKSSNPLSKKRLELLKEYDNGFVLANKDLENRGYGNFFGKEQSGFSDFKLFNYIEDYDIYQRVLEENKE